MDPTQLTAIGKLQIKNNFAQVMWKDPQTNQWYRPDSILMRG